MNIKRKKEKPNPNKLDSPLLWLCRNLGSLSVEEHNPLVFAVAALS